MAPTPFCETLQSSIADRPESLTGHDLRGENEAWYSAASDYPVFRSTTMVWAPVLLVCCGAVPIFDARAENPWDELRRAFYLRQFANGAVYEHDLSLDHPPWIEWASFYNNEEFHTRVIAALDAFLEQPRAAVELQAPLRRAVLLRDLWPVFDAQTHSYRAKGEVAAKRQTELAARVSRVMRRLELTEHEARQLPDNYKALLDKKAFPTEFEAAAPDKGFTPANLFDESGPWVPFARTKKTPGGRQHAESAGYRSIFVPYIRVSARRQETIDFLERYQQSNAVEIPAGTMLALVRRMVVPTTSGHIVATPIVEGLELIAVRPPTDRQFKFALDRRDLIAGGPGLRPLTKDDPIDAFNNFDTFGSRTNTRNQRDSDGEQFLLGKYEGPPPRGMEPMGNCFVCHGKTVGSRLFANTSGPREGEVSTWADQAQLMIAHKEKSAEWKAYQSLGN